jgi:ABC-type multidrug transport system fused ATPase/permease subunit
VPLRSLPLAALRQRVLLVRNGDWVFPGTLRDCLRGVTEAGDEHLLAALRAVSAQDILDGLPDGLDAPVAEQGRNFSGGQLQRLRLARALLADPEIMIAVEPTSAVDAHTEARIAGRLGAYRQGRTTVVFTTSPLVLHRADLVAYVTGGMVAATGPHARLLSAEPGYRALVTRGAPTANDPTEDDTGVDGTGVDGTGVDGTGVDGTGVDGTIAVAEASA